jgi:hypothetical protein
MAITGRRPKPDGHAVNRNPPTHDWTIVQDVPYTGPAPGLPRDVAWSPAARRRWKVIRHMPHAALWGPGDWESAIDYLRLFEMRKDNPSAELRLRGNELGLTAAARVGLRIRYVKPEPASTSPEPAKKTAEVANMDDYRGLYGEE